MDRDVLHARRILERAERVGEARERDDLGSHLVVVVVGTGHATGEVSTRGCRSMRAG